MYLGLVSKQKATEPAHHLFDKNPIPIFSSISINDIGLKNNNNKYLGCKTACTKTPNNAMEPDISTKPLSAMGRAIERLKAKKELKIESDRKIRIQGISWQSEQSNLALLRIQILIFADILGPMCS